MVDSRTPCACAPSSPTCSCGNRKCSSPRRHRSAAARAAATGDRSWSYPANARAALARMRESTYTASIGKLLPPTVYKLKLCLPYTAGVADSWYSGTAGDLWIEWKYLKSIPRVVDLVGGKHPLV